MKTEDTIDCVPHTTVIPTVTILMVMIIAAFVAAVVLLLKLRTRNDHVKH